MPRGMDILRNRSTEPKRLCGYEGSGPYDYGGKSATFNTYRISYSHVCGWVVGYQFSVPNAFRTGSNSIDSYYVDGVSLIHGPPGARQHIWTFAAGYSEDNYLVCPCTNLFVWMPQQLFPPLWETTFSVRVGPLGICWVIMDTSQMIHSGSPPCCELSYPPGVTAIWFCRQLPQTTTDVIEARICRDSSADDTPIELVELYVRWSLTDSAAVWIKRSWISDHHLYVRAKIF